MKWFYIFMLVAILISLFSALFALMKPADKNGTAMLKALTLRVALSIVLFLILIVVKSGLLNS